jgi:excisionase family DNA binding protein
MTFNEKDEILTVTDLVQSLDVDRWVIYKWIKTNRLKSFKQGREYRFKKSEIKSFVEYYEKNNESRKKIKVEKMKLPLTLQRKRK